jgi:hypothetical protein
MAGIVNHDVEATVVGDNFVNASFRRGIRGDVQFDGPEIDVVLGGVPCDYGDRRRVTSGGLAHAGIDDVAGIGERARGECAKTA